MEKTMEGLKAYVKKYYDSYNGWTLENLWIYRNGHLTGHISIDRKYGGVDWNERHGMSPVYEVVADNGEKFTIWKSERYINAIPA